MTRDVRCIVAITDAIGTGTILNDDVPPSIVADQVFTISEDAAVNQLVGAIQVDNLTAGSVAWTIVFGNTGNAFSINSDNQINVAAALDRETLASYTLTLSVTDGVNSSDQETIVINILDVNDNAPTIPEQTLSVSDDAVNGTVVGTITVNDLDESPVFGDFIITEGNQDGVFALNNSTGELTIDDDATLDFESTASYTLTVTVRDGVNQSSAGTVTIEVIDTNDPPSEIIVMDVNDEDDDDDQVTIDFIETTAIGTAIAELTTEDVDSDEFTYSLENNEDGLYTISGSQIVVNALLDYSATPTDTITVVSTDSDGASVSLEVILFLIPDASLGLDKAGLYNVITPGRVDGKNDFWVIDGIEAFPDAEIVINDKNGNVVFRSIGYENPFNGTQGNKVLPTDTYFYELG